MSLSIHYKLFNLVKSIILVVIVCILLFFFAEKSFAFTLSPSSGTFTTSDTITVDIIADPVASDERGIDVNLTMTNLTVTGYTDGSNTLTLGQCSGSKFASNQVCVAIGATDVDLVSGRIMGTFTLTPTGDGAASIATTSGANNEYGSGTQTVGPGTLATFTVGTSSTNSGGSTTDNTSTGSSTTLPNTSTGDESSSSMSFWLANIGVLFLVVGVALNQRYLKTKN